MLKKNSPLIVSQVTSKTFSNSQTHGYYIILPIKCKVTLSENFRVHGNKWIHVEVGSLGDGLVIGFHIPSSSMCFKS